MNRQIKFRVWNKPAKCFIQDINNEIATFTLLTLSDYLKEYSISNIDHLIFQQYTGLNDLTGKEIYEGDIVEWGSLKYLVEWNDISYKWQGRCPNYHLYHHPTTENFRDLMGGVVIGNIFENLELLKYEPGA